MKKRIFLVSVLFLASAVVDSQAGAQQLAAPNVYRLSGGHMHVTYTTTDKNGQPHFSYQNGNQTLSFTGNQIRETKTDLGTLVSVTIRMTIDTGSTSFTLLVPTVNLTSPSSPAQIHTYGITTVHKFSVVPAMNKGQTELYTTTDLSGTASQVFF
jgi:hypothetical protein